VEGVSTDPGILATRRKATRNLMATLLFSAGIPMITAGDEFARTQAGNNNAYCHDDELTWLDWRWDQTQQQLLATVRRLIELRRQNPALRPVRYGKSGESVPNASQMDWFDADGGTMSQDDWQSTGNRTLQYLAASTPEFEAPGRILLIVHGLETSVSVTLPHHQDVSCYTLLWDSADEQPTTQFTDYAPGSRLQLSPTSMQLFTATD
jgi:glycogen operon protein